VSHAVAAMDQATRRRPRGARAGGRSGQENEVIAAVAGCSRSTVASARARLESIGLVAAAWPERAAGTPEAARTTVSNRRGEHTDGLPRVA